MPPTKNKKGKPNQKSNASSQKSNTSANDSKSGNHSQKKSNGCAWKAERRVRAHFILFTYLLIVVTAIFAQLYKMNWYMWDLELMVCIQMIVGRYPYFVICRSYYRRLLMKPKLGTADTLSLITLAAGACLMAISMLKCLYEIYQRHTNHKLAFIVIPMILESAAAPFVFRTELSNFDFSAISPRFPKPDVDRDSCAGDVEFNLGSIVYLGAFTVYYMCFLPMLFSAQTQHLMLGGFQFFLMVGIQVILIQANVMLILVMDLLLVNGKGIQTRLAAKKILPGHLEPMVDESDFDVFKFMRDWAIQYIFEDPAQSLLAIQLICTVQIAFEMVCIYVAARWETHCLLMISLVPVVASVSSFSFKF